MNKDLYIELLEEKVKLLSDENVHLKIVERRCELLEEKVKKLESFKKIIFKHRDKRWDDIEFAKRVGSDDLLLIYRQRWLGIHLAIKEYEEQE